MSASARKTHWHPPQVPLWVVPLVLLSLLWLVGALRSMRDNPVDGGIVTPRAASVSPSSPLVD
jgi:hypothetical protein